MRYTSRHNADITDDNAGPSRKRVASGAQGTVGWPNASEAKSLISNAYQNSMEIEENSQSLGHINNSYSTDLAIVESVSNPLSEEHIGIIRETPAADAELLTALLAPPPQQVFPSRSAIFKLPDDNKNQSALFIPPKHPAPPSSSIQSRRTTYAINVATTYAASKGKSLSNPTSPVAEEDSQELSKKVAQLERNRKAAKMHRLRHKEHVASMEAQMFELTKENERLKAENEELRQRVADLELILTLK